MFPSNIPVSTGLVETAWPLDYELITSYNLTISATDEGNSSLTGTGTLLINILDENDNNPQFNQTSYEVTLEENLLTNGVVAQLTASDADSATNGQLQYSIIGEDANSTVSIDATTGVVTVRNSTAFDFEMSEVLFVRIKAEDMGETVLSAETLVSH